VYGRSKRDGELGIQASGARHLVLRTSWVVGAHGQNFLKTMLRFATERDSLRVVADQTGVPTSADWLAGISLQAIQQSDQHGLQGLFHATPAGQTSWHAYAQYLLARATQLGWTLKVASQDVQPISTAEYPLPASRPAYGLLDSHALASHLGQDWPPWQEGVDKVLHQLRPTAQAD